MEILTRKKSAIVILAIVTLLMASICGATILFERGPVSQLPATAPQGHPLWTTDTHHLYVGYSTGILDVTGGGGGSMVYPLAGIAYSNGTSWGSSFTSGNPIPFSYLSGVQAVLGFTPLAATAQAVDSAKLNGQLPSYYQIALGFTPENVANKSTDGTMAANSDTLYPSQKAVVTYVAAHAGSGSGLPYTTVTTDTDGKSRAKTTPSLAFQSFSAAMNQNPPAVPTATTPSGSDTTHFLTNAAVTNNFQPMATGTSSQLMSGAGGNVTVGSGLSLSSGTLTATGSGGMTNPMTTAGDIIYGGTGGAPTRLGIGTSNYFLVVSSGNPAWASLGTMMDTALSLSSTGLLKRTGSGAYGIATAGTDYSTPSATETLTNKTLTNPIETTYSNTASSWTVSLANGTVQDLTTNSNATITLPSSVVGTSYMIRVHYGGTHTITWAGGGTLKWPSGTAPTATSTSGKVDIYVFTCDGTNTYGADGGRSY